MTTLVILFWICLGVVFYAYVGYGIVLLLLVKVKRAFGSQAAPRQVADDELPEVTLLIAAYNEQEIVDEKMRNCRQLDYPAGRLTIVWVTDGSNDATNDRLAQYADARVLFSPERRGKTAALNRSMQFIDTPIVVFTDANTMLNRQAIRRIAECFVRNPRVGCVAGEKRIADAERSNASTGGEGIYWKYESTLKRWDSQLCTAVGAAGELFAVRRELFEEMATDTLLDDFMMSMRIAARGYKIEYCAEAYAVEGGSADMVEEGKRKVRIAAGGLQSVWRLRGLLNVFRYGTMSFQYVSHRVLRWTIAPVMLLALLPINVAIVALNPASWLYVALLACQVLFYMAALWGYALQRRHIKNKLLYVPYYFLFMNLNVLRGFAYLWRRRGGSSGAWEKSRRA